ncbi:hypothetical protein CHARACLAT_006255 [Characodon lateralis]|uniref:Uncharacterized protein n=1 Tax=Characodon lateralis TaxID=208331 RepID=A0ABU7DY70_9TELE|nr:hypothetical protein [Characodon lateralis]
MQSFYPFSCTACRKFQSWNPSDVTEVLDFMHSSSFFSLPTGSTVNIPLVQASLFPGLHYAFCLLMFSNLRGLHISAVFILWFNDTQVHSNQLTFESNLLHWFY